MKYIIELTKKEKLLSEKALCLFADGKTNKELSAGLLMKTLEKFYFAKERSK